MIVRKIEIDIEYITENEDAKLSPVNKIRRTVRVDGKEVYNDMMSWRLYYAPDGNVISQLERFLLGLEYMENTKNIGSNSRDKICFFKKVWRQFIRKKV